MCLAIYKPKGANVGKKRLQTGFARNPDGAGFAVSMGDEVSLHRGFFTFDDFWAAYKPHSDCAAVIHFRQATHGQISPENCHPWPLCNGRFALVHNGILDIKSSEEKSDTGHFADLVLDRILSQGISPGDPALRFLVESAIGDENKIAILLADGSATIYNEKHGHWNNGAWYSNHSYEHYRHRRAMWPDVAGCWSERGSDDQRLLAIASDYESLGMSAGEAMSMAAHEMKA